jgi:hypothetical protein
VDCSKLPQRILELNKTLRRDGSSLAEDNDYPSLRQGGGWGNLDDYREWLEVRGSKWVLKSPDHIARLPQLWEVFPEARFLWCLRPAGPVLSSIREYWQVAGVGPEYPILPTVDSALHYVRAFPERFDCIFTPSIPEWESDRDDPIGSPEAFQLEIMLQQVKGACRNVTSRDFAKLYS